MNHSLPPGTSLPSEAQLQVRYGVSRSVVRQALGALTDERLIERGCGRGSTVPPRCEHHRLVHRASPVLLLEGTSFDQHGQPVEVFSTWHHPDHVVFDIDIERESTTAPVAAGGPSSAINSPDAMADRARRLGADLLHFAEQVSDLGR